MNSSPPKPRKTAGKWKRFSSNIWKLLVYIWRFVVEWFSGAEAEKPKVIISTSPWRPFFKLAIHLIPTGATIVLCWFHFTGYFIGSTLAGSIAATAQSMDRLLLQVTAKLYEIFVVMSLSVLVFDKARDKLMFGDEGLPLGLLLSHMCFSDITFLKSHEFRGAWKGISKKGERLWFYLLVVTCALVALFVAPSSAILIIPTWYTDWPAGGAKFWLNGDLTPTTFDTSSVQNSQCLDYRNDISVLDNMTWTYASCPWAGYPYLKRYFEAPRLGASHRITYSYGSFVQDLTMNWADGVDILYAVDTVRTWAVASNIAIAAFARHIADINWAEAIYDSKETQLGHVRSQYRFAQQNGTVANVKADVPVVRTQCLLADRYMNNAPSESPSANEEYLPFPIIPDFSGSRARAYFIPVPLFNGTYTATQWLPIPSGPSPTNNGPPLSNYPTAFLVVHNADFYGSPTDITCSVQADWVPGTHVTGSIAYEIATDQQGQVGHLDNLRLRRWSRDGWPSNDSEIMNLGPPPEFAKPSTWRSIQLDLDWLDILAPTLDSATPGNTTLALMLSDVLGLVSATSFPANWAPWNIFTESYVFEQVTSVIASSVADALSRTGWEENYVYNLQRSAVASTPSSADGWNYGLPAWDGVWNALLDGKAVLQPNEPYRQTSGQMYPLQIELTGFGMRADELAFQLSITVLFVHVALVFYHVWFVISRQFKHRISDRWSSLTDMLILAQVSVPPEHTLEDTCAGVKSHATMRLPMRIRAGKAQQPGQETVQLLVGRGATGQDIEPGVKYGSEHAQAQSMQPLLQVNGTLPP